MTDIHDRSTVAQAALANIGGGIYRALLPPLASGQYAVAGTGAADGKPRRISDLLIVLPE